MKFKISYFYHVRNLTPNQVPVSTAMFDPKWFHNFKGNNHIFVDKRGMINGLRIFTLAPDETCNGSCHGRDKCLMMPDSCDFLRQYRYQLFKLDFEKVIETLEQNVKYILEKNPKYDGKEEPECILMVYETPSNPCSERVALQEWFVFNGRVLEEFTI